MGQTTEQAGGPAVLPSHAAGDWHGCVGLIAVLSPEEAGAWQQHSRLNIRTRIVNVCTAAATAAAVLGHSLRIVFSLPAQSSPGSGLSGFDTLHSTLG